MKRKQYVASYLAVFQKEKDGGYSVWVPELPGCVSQGDTFEEAKANIKEAIELYLEDPSIQKSEIKESENRFITPITVTVTYA